mgnify:CR=1 FL=1
MLEATPKEERTGHVLTDTAETYKRRPNTITSRIQGLFASCGLDLYH